MDVQTLGEIVSYLDTRLPQIIVYGLLLLLGFFFFVPFFSLLLVVGFFGWFLLFFFLCPFLGLSNLHVHANPVFYYSIKKEKSSQGLYTTHTEENPRLILHPFSS